MTLPLKAGLAALALIVAPLALQAAPKEERGNNGHHNRSVRTEHGNGHAYGHDRRQGGDDEAPVGDDAASTHEHPCARGLAGRETSCVPPGQAAHGVTTEQWIGSPPQSVEDLQEIADESYGVIANTDQLGLDTGALEDGEVYALVGDTIVVIDEATGEVVSIVRRAAFPGRSNG